MANIDRIVKIDIALNTTGISKEGFSTMMIVAPHCHTLGRVATYTSADQLLDDGFKSTDKAYKMAVAAFSQIPRPALIKLGRQKVNGGVVTVGSVSSTGKYTVTVSTKDSNGNVTKKDYSYTNNKGSVSEILAGLVGEFTKDTDSLLDAVVENDSVKLTTKDSESVFAISVSKMLTFIEAESTEPIADTMSAIVGSDNDWYSLHTTYRTQEEVLEFAEWTEAHTKIYGVTLLEEGVTDSEVTTDTGYKLQEQNYYRTHWWYHPDADNEFVDVAITARCFSVKPGGETWALKKLAGTSAVNLSETKYVAVTKKNGNTFEKVRNISITQNGKVAAGEWIDVIRFRDWLQEEMSVNILNALVNSNKIPYTDEGIAIIESQIKMTLDLGRKRGGIAPDEYNEDGTLNRGYVVEVPLATSISANTKASRVLEDVKFKARLAGAIHVVNVDGAVTYENLLERGV